MGTTGFSGASAWRRGDSIPRDAGAHSAALVERLHAVGENRYHDKHPFHQQLVSGTLERPHVQAWVANRYYYQKQIPVKDAAILANLPSAAHRRVWISRIIDHDGKAGAQDGGTAAWMELARAVGLDAEDVRSERAVAAGTRFAVDAYVTFARTRPWIEAVASSLTELFGPPVMERRIAAIIEKYPWIDPAGLAYFEQRIPLARRDADAALRWVLDEAATPEIEQRCVDALTFKCDVLWSILDATALACGVFK
ncbi:MAG: pyrroloquinoline-quinone synthase PqqC [Candidatus Eremiobacteraeota bacterium]|nr:pyrroloquinoline-quinone synthase PqqC [Candidatus Eremiobacteraeota bacterium]